MPDQFFADQKDMEQLKKFYKAAPKAFQRVSAATLSSMAFADRKSVQRQLKKDMTVRTPSFLKKGTRIEMAKQAQPISRQESKSGSIRTPRHDAWEHIQKGSATRITQFTDAGRRGDSSEGVAKKEAKAKQQTTTQESDYRLSGTGDKRSNLFMQRVAADKTRRRKPFFLPRAYKRMPEGIYKFKGGRVGTLVRGRRKFKRTLIKPNIARISTPGTDITPDKIDWKGKATKRAITEKNVKLIWIRNQNRELKKIAEKAKLKY